MNKRVGRDCQNCSFLPSRHDARRVGFKTLLKSNKKQDKIPLFRQALGNEFFFKKANAEMHYE
jgi:hypothetical protein